MQPRPISLHIEEANGREYGAALQVCCSRQDACPEEAVPWLFLRAMHHCFSHCLLALAWCFRSLTCTQANTAATNLRSCCRARKRSPESSDFPQISACSHELAHPSAWLCSPVPWAAVSRLSLSYALKELNCSFLSEAWPARLSALMRFVIAYRSKPCPDGICFSGIERKGEVTSKANRTTGNKINFHTQFLL